jgi:hypothetical protein
MYTLYKFQIPYYLFLICELFLNVLFNLQMFSALQDLFFEYQSNVFVVRECTLHNFNCFTFIG